MELTLEETKTIHYLRTLGHEDCVTEIRIIDAGYYGRKVVRRNRGILSGYYDDDHYEQAVMDVRPFVGNGNVYATLNPVHPDLLARAYNKLVPYPKATTGDDEIMRLNWLPIDIDPYRPAEISATESELTSALQRRDEVVAFLVGILGEGHHLTGMSGNGGHAMFRIDLPNTSEYRVVVKEIGDGLARRFSDPKEEGTPRVFVPPRVGLDNTVYNPARIWKLPGTVAVKGDSVGKLGRVHRRATVELREVTPANLGEFE